MPYFSESSTVFQKSYFKCSRKILCRFQLRKVGSYVSVWMTQSCVRTPISVEKPNSSRLHPFRRHGNTSRHTLEFEKIPAFVCRHGVGRQLAPIWMLGKHRPNAEILDKEIVYVHFVSVRTLWQHRPDVALIWKCEIRDRLTLDLLSLYIEASRLEFFTEFSIEFFTEFSIEFFIA